MRLLDRWNTCWGKWGQAALLDCNRNLIVAVCIEARVVKFLQQLNMQERASAEATGRSACPYL